MSRKAIRFEDLIGIVRESLETGHEVTIMATGVSMEPLFKAQRDEVTLALRDTFHRYDLILYQRTNGQYVLHRIVGKDDRGYILRGDNQHYKEYGIQDHQIIAKVVRFKRNGKGYACDDWRYQLYSHTWVHTNTLRKILCKLKALFLRK